MAVTIKRKSLKKTSKKNVQSRKRINKSRKNMKTIRNMRGGGKPKKLKLPKGVTSEIPHELHKHIPKSVHTYLEEREKGSDTTDRILRVKYDGNKYNFYTYNPARISPEGIMLHKYIGDAKVDKAVYHHVSRTDLHKAFKKVLGSNNPKTTYEALKKTEEFKNIKSDVDAALIKASLETDKLDSSAIEQIIKKVKDKKDKENAGKVYAAIHSHGQGQGKEPLNQSKKALQGNKSKQILTELKLPPPVPPRRLARQSTILPPEIVKENQYVNSDVGKTIMFKRLLGENKILINEKVFSNLMDFFQDKGINSENIDANIDRIIKEIERLEKAPEDLQTRTRASARPTPQSQSLERLENPPAVLQTRDRVRTNPTSEYLERLDELINEQEGKVNIKYGPNDENYDKVFVRPEVIEAYRIAQEQGGNFQSILYNLEQRRRESNSNNYFEEQLKLGNKPLPLSDFVPRLTPTEMSSASSMRVPPGFQLGETVQLQNKRTVHNRLSLPGVSEESSPLYARVTRA